MNLHPKRSFLNMMADWLTLVALAVAGVGHVLPWTNARYHRYRPYDYANRIEFNGNDKDRQKREEARKKQEAEYKQREAQLIQFQAWHAKRSGIALGALAVLVGLSLTINWSWGARRFLTLLMFGCAVTALIFEVMLYSPYQITEAHVELGGSFGEGVGFPVSVAATGFALFFCLVRMLWSMPQPRTQPEIVETERADTGGFPRGQD